MKDVHAARLGTILGRMRKVDRGEMKKGRREEMCTEGSGNAPTRIATEWEVEVQGGNQTRREREAFPPSFPQGGRWFWGEGLASGGQCII